MAVMEDHAAEVTVQFKRAKPHPLYGKRMERKYETQFFVLPESSITEDFSTEDIWKQVQNENKENVESLLGNGWVFEALEVDSVMMGYEDM